MNIDSKFENVGHRSLFKNLSKLDKTQFKIFYSILVHYYTNYKCFISTKNFYNLWCELNLLCHELDESFPEQYDDLNEIKSFCQTHPYYFIDELPLNIISNLFSKYIDDRVDILTNIVKTLYEVNIFATYVYANKTLGLNEPINELVSDTLDHIKYFS